MATKPTLKTGHFADAEQKPMSRGLRIYQKIAILFVFVALFLLLAVLYLSISHATITIVPNTQVVSSTVSAEVATNASAVGQIEGLVIQKSVAQAREFWLPSEGATAIEAKAGGMVSLINESGVDQPLVATTRLLSEEGVLFRIDEAVVVPANGQIEVMAHADQPGISGEIGPTQFTIPGLAESKQAEIYAVSVEKMAGGVSYKRVVSQSDLDEAGNTLADEILENTKELLRSEAEGAGFTGEVFSIEAVEKKSDTEPGVEIASFTISITATVTGVFYDTTDLENYAKTSLYNQTSTGFQVTSVKEDGVQVTLQSVDTERATATLSAYLDGFAVIAPNNELLNKDRFTGRSANEVVNLLEVSDAVETASVAFTPFWLKRVPTLQDHIRIVIE